MSIHVALRHITRYHYDRLINLDPQVVRLRPAPHCRTRILSYSMQVLPAEHFVNWQQDPQSNHLARLVFPERTTSFEIAVELVAEMSVLNPFDFFLEESAEEFPFKYDQSLDQELAPYFKRCKTGKAFEKYVKGISLEKTRTIDFLVGLNQRIFNDIRYLIRMEPGVQTPDETLTNASGSCRDSAWLMVQVLREIGLAARFVSGYLIQLTSDVKAIDGPSGPEADFTDLHAWCEVYLPGAGWIGLDPTSGLLAGEGHIPLACSPEPGSAAPITGTLDECEVSFEHDMQVTRVYESPRTSKPYTDTQWQRIAQLGFEVDKILQSHDIRLTMGGEPTFVADGDRGGAEWNTDALGPTKRAFGVSLLQRLARHYGAGGLFHFGQGKWYPGEQLPRWALSMVWRKDGNPVWHNADLLDDERSPREIGFAQGQRFIEHLAVELGVTTLTIQPGYEDAWHYLLKERNLPVNVDPFDSKLADPIERARLRKVFTDGLDKTVGHCLPLAYSDIGWKTSHWPLRDKRLYLIPGDSPMGYRLPLASLPWLDPRQAEVEHQVDPLSPVMQSPIVVAQGPRTIQAVDPAPKPVNLVRTALCVQVRNGHLYVFMPPLTTIDAYFELVSAVERTAAELGQPVILEGYPPPRDTRVNLLQITPDPGVLEVNIQPCSNWGELLELTETLYEEARLTRLSSEKFMLDGRHSGTGGGNHFVLGGATPADSPFLRRPDLLASLLRYWHNHPGLSYLFSGLFIGPTSQAPRVDEARSDQVHELELALSELDRQIAKHKGHVPLWMVDRVLRNILVDVTGNTHRSEFCIDKLYNPDSTTGRLGLLELRAFEMPPNARMSLTQQLLLRALVAKFWQTPYKAKLVKWGNRLHDQFMLSSFVANDLEEVVDDLNASGIAFDMEWLAPHFAFRFPKLGDYAINGIELDLHAALEPWHVLGEEGTAGGTVRYVDSSVERLEVKLRNYVSERYVLTCNGVAVPLHHTGREGEFVAGVRYRAWQPSSALHPTIEVDSPLHFDIYDTWNRRSLGGCTYHVAHPGGRNYDIFPVNAFEAESRRLARFFRMGHKQGQFDFAPAKTRDEFPMTLDLRWV
ncbi:MAG TPA: transglutaminase family protein [Limnobacter sp.]|uniref:transglutaminase family protein n=1 Tax=Limnobacter sp. TaxID=2003368 RepID=UPI002E2ECA48|nr:transglutaminase family protein [Limnobacter sp.]HEX5486291.1 transglutaminase family protein [Limnobacter sp.]